MVALQGAAGEGGLGDDPALERAVAALQDAAVDPEAWPAALELSPSCAAPWVRTQVVSLLIVQRGGSQVLLNQKRSTESRRTRRQFICETAVAGSISLVPHAAAAGGFFGDVVEGLCGGCGLGRSLDREHEKLGNPLDVPGRILRESGVETLGPLLAQAIRYSRNDARSAGTRPIPQDILALLADFYSMKLLSRVEYRVGQGHELSAQANSIRFGDASAVTLIDTVVFADPWDARNNDTLWAHEVFHVNQYSSWGLSDFAKRYVRNWREVENEAYSAQTEYEQRVLAQKQQTNSRPDHSTWPSSAPAAVCATPFGACGMAVPIPMGSSCYCQTWQGPIWGVGQ